MLHSMVESAIPLDEAARLETLCDFDILDTAPEVAFERLVQLTSRVFDVPMSMISLVDEQRQWAKACIGPERSDDDRRSISFCSHAILSRDVLIVLDAMKDERFCDNPLVLGKPHIRFYAGAPLITSNGSRIGTLCLMDQQPHTEFSAKDIDNLCDLAAAVVDALELRRVNAQLRRTETLFSEEQNLLKETFAALEEGVVMQNSSGQIVTANASAATILGLTMDQLLGLTSLDPRWRAVHEDGSAFLGEDHPVPVALRKGVTVSNTLMGVHHSDGRLTWLSVNARPLFHDNETKPYAAVGSFRDVTEQHNRHAQLEFRVNHDSLTGLPNRDALNQLLDENRQTVFALGYLDLNGFKSINDRHGHAAGDELLKQTAQRLRAHLRSEDRVVRIGGDEFVLFLPTVQTADQVAGVKKRIAAAFSTPFDLRGAEPVQVSTEAGIAFYPEEARDFEELLKLADERMYEHKALNP